MGNRVLLLHSRFCGPSARRLASALSELGHDVETSRESPQRPSKFSHLIRWGSSVDPTLDEVIPHHINSAAGIATSSDRLKMLDKLRIGDIRCPRVSREPPEAGIGRRYIVRSRHGQCGNDIQPYTRGISYDVNSLFVAYYPSQYELRFHVFQGASILSQVKVNPNFDPNSIPPDGIVIRNYDNGWRLVPLSARNLETYGLPPTLEAVRDATRQESKSAVKEVGLDFGATDVIITGDGLSMVLEVNSAPGVEGYTLTQWSNRFDLWLKGN